jgi:hypothetical protein
VLKYFNIIEYVRVSRKVPFLLALVFWLLLIVGTVPFRLFGFNSTGWGWVIPLLVSLVIIVISRHKIQFPVHIWIMWILVIVAGLLRPHIYSLQSTMQIITPIIIGVAISKTGKSFSWPSIIDFIERTFILWLVIIPLIKLPRLLLGVIPEVTGLALEGMTSLFFQAVFLTLFLNLKERKYLILYLLALSVPLIALTRGPMLASIVLLALVISPLRVTRRLLILGISLLIGVLIFNSERFQMKSFRMTGVTIGEVVKNPDMIRTTGRKQMWKLVVQTGESNKWWGEGSNAAVSKAISIGYGKNYLLHNDWLRIKYDYGIIGISLFSLAVLIQILHARKILSTKAPIVQAVGLGAISAFFPFMAVMYTDNILIYAHSFGSLQFVLLGLMYSEREEETDEGSIYSH